MSGKPEVYDEAKQYRNIGRSAGLVVFGIILSIAGGITSGYLKERYQMDVDCLWSGPVVGTIASSFVLMFQTLMTNDRSES